MTSFSGRSLTGRISLTAAVAVLAALLLATAAGCARARRDGPSGEAGDSAAVAGSVLSGQIHPRFTLSDADLQRITADLPPAVAESITAAPRRFLDLVAQTLSAPPELTWLVDRSHPLDPGYEPSDLVHLDTLAESLALSREGHRLRSIVVPDLLEMVGQARSQGVTLLISSAYRSYTYQDELYNYWVAELGQEEADRVSARPGTSQHQLGTTIDFGCICDAFADTDAGRWLAANAWRFGFSLSYPEGREAETGYAFESWHFRYIGRGAAMLEQEFFEGMQQHLTEFLNTRQDELAQSLVVI